MSELKVTFSREVRRMRWKIIGAAIASAPNKKSGVRKFKSSSLVSPSGRAGTNTLHFAAPLRARTQEIKQRQFQRPIRGHPSISDAKLLAGRADGGVMRFELPQIFFA